jgi:hypothetical protein
MVDYNAALPQLAQFQAPNVLAMASQANQMQAANMLMQQRARELQKENALAAAGARFGVNTPEYAAAAGGIDPEAGLKAYHYQSQIVNQQRQALGEARRARLAEIQSDEKLMDLAAKHGDEFKNSLRMIDAYPEQERPAVYGKLISTLPDKLKSVFPPTYSPDAVRLGMMTTAEIVAAAKPKESQYLMGPAGPIAIDKNTGTYSVVPEGGAAPAAVAPAAAAAAAAAAPVAAAAGVPAAVAMQPAAANGGYLAGLDRAEGRGKNPMSSAQGKYQFIDNTFVNTAKKVFPELADKPAKEVLALRGTKLQDGSQIEDALEQRFRADNIASLANAGIQPTPGNTYLAHFLGAGGARSVLGADPSTPVSSLLSADAIAANKSVLEGKTAGEVAAWAANKFGNQPGLAASMTAGNARLGGAPAGFVPANAAPMSLGAPTVNNALMANMFGAPAQAPQNAMLSLQPQIAGALTPPAAAPAAAAPAQLPLTGLARERATITQEKLAAAGAEQTQRLEIDKQFSETERAQARQEFDKTLANIIKQYQDLGAKGMLVKSGETTLVNRAKAAAATAAPGLTTVLSPERGEAVATLTNMRQTMLSALMGATGMSAKNIDSNAEMRAYLNSLSNPGQPVKTIVDTLNNLSERFGTNMKLKETDLTGGKPQNPSSSKAGPNVDDLLKKYE